MAEVRKALYGSPDRPLRIGEIEIPCYVLDDDRRVLVQAGMMTALGISSGQQAQRLASFASTQSLREFISKDTRRSLSRPILFKAPTGGSVAYGFEASLLIDICNGVIEADRHRKLHHTQNHIAERCSILLRSFAKLGITALVDEATGYQHARKRWALRRLLERYIAEELRAWVKTFPDDFYEELFRLRGWDMNDIRSRPGVVGRWTNDLVYSRLAPGVLTKLQEITPRDDQGRLRNHLHRRLSHDVGHPELLKHLHAVISLMRASQHWDQFYELLQRAFPKPDENLLLPYSYSEN